MCTNYNYLFFSSFYVKNQSFPHWWLQFYWKHKTVAEIVDTRLYSIDMFLFLLLLRGFYWKQNYLDSGLKPALTCIFRSVEKAPQKTGCSYAPIQIMKTYTILTITIYRDIFCSIRHLVLIMAMCRIWPLMNNLH